MHTFSGSARKLEHFNISWLQERLKLGLRLLIEIFGSSNVNLVDDDEDELVCEEGFDALEELHLSLDGVSTLLRQIHEIEDRGA